MLVKVRAKAQHAIQASQIYNWPRWCQTYRVSFIFDTLGQLCGDVSEEFTLRLKVWQCCVIIIQEVGEKRVVEAQEPTWAPLECTGPDVGWSHPSAKQRRKLHLQRIDSDNGEVRKVLKETYPVVLSSQLK
jgi:hypothetical protein